MEQEPRPYPRLVLLGLVVVSFAAALPAGLWPPADWYLALAKPAWNPPAWVFGPVWSTLYLMMGIAAWRVWRATHERREQALRLWWIQLFLNALWTPLFFGWHRLDLALLEILVLFGFIAATARVVLAHRPRRRRAAGPVSRLGRIRVVPQLHVVAAQPLRQRHDHHGSAPIKLKPMLRWALHGRGPGAPAGRGRQAVRRVRRRRGQFARR